MTRVSPCTGVISFPPQPHVLGAEEGRRCTKRFLSLHAARGMMPDSIGSVLNEEMNDHRKEQHASFYGIRSCDQQLGVTGDYDGIYS